MSTTTDYVRKQVAGRGIPVPGNDIDTDRIIPARFLKEVTFESMGTHAFEDARKANPEHPFNSPAYQGASVLVVGQNFGCGSSREHAPQALMRWGIRAIVGGSFGEIFFGNCTMLGIPCLTVSQADLEWMQREIGRALLRDGPLLLGLFPTRREKRQVAGESVGHSEECEAERHGEDERAAEDEPERAIPQSLQAARRPGTLGPENGHHLTRVTHGRGPGSPRARKCR